jgi:hypothetical protein
MIKPTDLQRHVDPQVFTKEIAGAVTTKKVDALIAQLPVVAENEYIFNPKDPYAGWKEGGFHWYPVGGERGNAGRIKLAGSPINPIGERTINGMEALIEMMRQLELKSGPATPPTTPREAVKRYFELPPLEAVPGWRQPIRGQKPKDYARTIASKIRIKLVHEGRPAEYTVMIEDDGIGQTPDKMHSTLLSLGESDKADKPYLIGVFGQGGSSTFAASTYSWIMTKRHPELLGGSEDGIGWTIIKQIYPTVRRDPYFAYLAAHPDGRVPILPASAANLVGLTHGTRFVHVSFNFGKTEPARRLYSALNHLLFNPVLPYELYTGPDRRPDPMWGNGYRLSRRYEADKQHVLDKTFGPHVITKG